MLPHPRLSFQCVENLESILRSDKAVVYWLRSGCMHLDREGPEIVKPCPAHAICAWVPNLFADVGIISPRNSLAPLCPRDFKYLPRIPKLLPPPHCKHYARQFYTREILKHEHLRYLTTYRVPCSTFTFIVVISSSLCPLTSHMRQKIMAFFLSQCQRPLQAVVAAAAFARPFRLRLPV